MTLEGLGSTEPLKGGIRGRWSSRSRLPRPSSIWRIRQAKKKKKAETAATAATQTPTSLSASRSLQDDAAPPRVAPSKSRLSTTPHNLACTWSIRGTLLLPFPLPREIKRLAPWKKSYEQVDSILKSRDITLSTKVHLVKVLQCFQWPCIDVRVGL